MPVPVPRHPKSVAHPVLKNINCGGGQANPFQNLTCTLPVSPTGPPPSFGTREQWINSLPTWRRTKPRRIWEDDARFANSRIEQDFYRGLTGAGNASVIKGAHAQACIPPQYNPIGTGQPLAGMETDNRPGSDGDADDEMSSDYSAKDRNHLDNQSEWTASSSIGSDVDAMLEDRARVPPMSTFGVVIDPPYDDQVYERGAFTPIFEDQSPGTASGQDRDSSPLEPITPFGDFVDRAVASTQSFTEYDNALSNDVVSQGADCHSQCYQVEPLYQSIAEQPCTPLPEVATPSATVSYKKLAEPLSEWVANYVWKVCTTGLSLPSMFARSSSKAMSPSPIMPPSYLAASVHSLLLSTLLQPSAVFLAIWYIVRLPVYFSAVALGPEHVKENRFRAALLGDAYLGFDQEAMEASAPFRLIVLGCMLANKWLDDHTFSNKTWHNISNVPIQALNKLESLTLDIFTYDLTVPSRDWSQWLAHVQSYHSALASPARPQPISRPSTNPHMIIRRVIEEIVQAPVACSTSSVPQPVFLGLEERKREKMEQEHAMAADVLEIDLDEDGPLREEYLPKRRISGAGSHRNSVSIIPPIIDSMPDITAHWQHSHVQEMGNLLPPPARWSPAGDEPILRERNRVSGQYVAVQPPAINIAPYHPPYYPSMNVGYPQWNTGGAYAPVKPQSTYVYDFPPIDTSNPAAYNSYPYAPQIAISHSRSQSLCYDQENVQTRNHIRSYSQSRFEYRCSDLRMTANELVPHNQGDISWTGTGHYP